MKHLKKFEELHDENKKVIDEAYDDYISEEDSKAKEIHARLIRRMAAGFIINREGSLSDWIEKFKNEEIVLKELEKIKFDEAVKKYNL